jgi:hypothetical protein
MQLIKRKVKAMDEPQLVELKAYGYNSNGVFTISMKGEKDDEETLLNINSEDLRKLLLFLKKIEIEASKFDKFR